jgi:hypothetical protein
LARNSFDAVWRRTLPPKNVLDNLGGCFFPLSWAGDKMAATKGSNRKSGGRKYGKAAGKAVASAMHREKRGTLKSGKGGKGGTVKSRKQAIAIGLSEAREKGAKVPPKRAA